MSIATASIKCGNCSSTHESVAAVRACYGQPAATPRVAAAPAIARPDERIDYPATDKQIGFIKRLAAERDYRGGHQATVKNISAVLADLPLSKREASATITFLQGCAMKPAESIIAGPDTTGARVTEVGMYLKDDRFFRVYKARGGDHLLAKELVQEDGSWAFVYRGGPARLGLRSEHRMTREQAASFGQQYGVCCVCGALLTDPESVAAGIGPICGSRDYYAA